MLFYYIFNSARIQYFIYRFNIDLMENKRYYCPVPLINIRGARIKMNAKSKEAKISLRMTEEEFKKITSGLRLNEDTLKLAFHHFVEGKTVPEIAEQSALTKARIYAIVKRVKQAYQNHYSVWEQTGNLELPVLLSQYMKHLQIIQQSHADKIAYLEGLEEGLRLRLAGLEIQYKEPNTEADRDFNEGLKMIVQLGKILCP